MFLDSSRTREELDFYLRGEESLPELEEVLLAFWGNGLKYNQLMPCYPTGVAWYSKSIKMPVKTIQTRMRMTYDYSI